MSHVLAVGLGGCFGSIARYWLATAMHRQFGHGFPYGTLAVNLLGCFLLGSVIGLVEHRQMFAPSTRLFLTVGVLGGFTTFSTFGWETFDLLRNHQHLLAIGNVAANVLVGTSAVLAGWFLAKLFAL
jgi:fluoride exporter